MNKIATLIIVFIGSTLIASDSNAQRPRPDRPDRQRDAANDQKNMQQPTNHQHPPMMLQRFRRLDKNGDGLISADEVPQQIKQFLARIDINHDGQIDKSELMTALSNRNQNRGAEQRGQRRKPGGKQQGAAMDISRIIERLDKNGDGKVSADEAPERMQQHFAKIDQNGDRELDQVELKELMTRIRDGAAGRQQKNNPDRNRPQKPKRPGKKDV